MRRRQSIAGQFLSSCLATLLCTILVATRPCYANGSVDALHKSVILHENEADRQPESLEIAHSSCNSEFCEHGEGHAVDGGEEGEVFSEELLMRPVPDGKVLAHFQFTSQLEAKEHHHHKLFPKAIDHLVRKFSIREMELSFTQGRWDYSQWGLSDSISRTAAKPAGVELWVRFDLPQHEVEATWRNLTHAISGLFCASVNYLEGSAAVAQPAFLFSPGPEGPLCPNRNQNDKDGALGPIRYGALPREAVCTENLTPWLKLLPCRDQAGLTTLLDRPTVYGGHYHALRVHISADSSLAGWSGDFDVPRAVRLTQTLTTVHKPPAQQLTWSLESLFKRQLAGSCPVASLSNVYVEIESALFESLNSELGTKAEAEEVGKVFQQSNRVFELRPEADGLVRGCGMGEGRRSCGNGEGLLLRYDVARRGSSEPLNVRWRWKKPPGRTSWRPRGAPFRASWTLTGHGNERGGLAMILKRDARWEGEGSIRASANLGKGGEQFVEVVVFQMIPWWIRLYMHTLRVAIDGRQVSLLEFATRARVTPAEDRKQPAVLELVLHLPLNATTIILLADFDKGYLRVDEHPPDASRGLDIPSAILLFPTLRDPPLHSLSEHSGPLLRQMTAQTPVRMYTESLLVRLPIPDFSMPYNVTTLTCTALAMFIGSLFNALRRRLGEEERAASQPGKEKNKLKALLQRVKTVVTSSKLGLVLVFLLVAGITAGVFVLDEKGFFGGKT